MDDACIQQQKRHAKKLLWHSLWLSWWPCSVKTTCTHAKEKEKDDDARSYLQMFNNIKMDSQNHLVGNLCHL